MLLGFLHAGLAVKNLDESIKQYQALGYTVNNQFERPDLKARAAHLVRNDDTMIELWEFSDQNIPDMQFIQHHIALASDDLEVDVQSLQEAGYKLVIPVTQGAVYRYAFVQDVSGNSIEIAQSDSTG